MHIVQGTGQFPPHLQQRLIPPKMSMVLRLRNYGLSKVLFHLPHHTESLFKCHSTRGWEQIESFLGVYSEAHTRVGLCRLQVTGAPDCHLRESSVGSKA